VETDDESEISVSYFHFVVLPATAAGR